MTARSSHRSMRERPDDLKDSRSALKKTTEDAEREGF
jgi:hypothetical protein